jgi:hypothetical protein
MESSDILDVMHPFSRHNMMKHALSGRPPL